MESNPPRFFDKKATDEVFGLFGDVGEQVLREVELCLGDVDEGLLVSVSSEGRAATQENVS